MLAAFCLASAVPAAPLAKKNLPVEITAEGENYYMEGLAYAEGNVVVRYGADVIYADQVTFDKAKREVVGRGNVRIYTEGKYYRGERLTYNLDTAQVESDPFRFTQEKVFVGGEGIESPRKDYYKINKGLVTFDNREDPAFSMKANTVEIYPDDRIVLKNVGLYVGDMPFFWIPYVSQSLADDHDNIDISAGATTRWGAYVVSTYTWAWNKSWTTNLSFDYRTKRGFGGGGGFDFHPRDGDHAEFTSWFTDDWGTDIGVGGTDRPVEPDSNRYRVEYAQRFKISDGLYSQADINIWSDKYVTEDFFSSEFRTEREPDNFANLMYYDPNFTTTLLARFQANDLFDVVERKPEFIVEFKRQSLFNLPISYEGESSATYFHHVFDDYSDEASYDSVRYDTFHQFLYPRQYFNWLSFTPRAGFRATNYTRMNLADDGDGPSLTRYIFNAGFESSFKVSRTWFEAKNPELGIDGIRHVFEPFVNYSFVPEPNKTPDQFRGFDNRVPYTRVQPLNFPAYNSIDSITTTNVLRHGFRNKIQTKRDGRNVDLLDWSIYGDLNMEEEQLYGADALYPQIYTELDISPFPWLEFEVYATKALVDTGFDEVNTELTWQVHPAVEVSVGNRYLTNVDFLDDSNQVTFGTFWRFNEDWQFAQDLAVELDNGQIQEQRYTLYRDLRVWNAALSFIMRENRDVVLEDEFLVYFTLTLKAFPNLDVSVNN